MASIITLDSILLATLIALIGFVGWAGMRYINKDDAWKAATAETLADLVALRSVCIKEFAAREDLQEVFQEIRNHEGRISAIEARQNSFGPRPSSCSKGL